MKHYSGYLIEENYYEIHCNVGRHTGAGFAEVWWLLTSVTVAEGK